MMESVVAGHRFDNYQQIVGKGIGTDGWLYKEYLQKEENPSLKGGSQGRITEVGDEILNMGETRPF